MLLIARLFCLYLLSIPAYGQDTDVDLEPMYLDETYYLDYSHPAIQRVLNEVLNGSESKIMKAIKLHNYVQERIIFGFSSAFYDMKASDVLASGKGFCNNQSTLFAALLRAADIPARHRFFSLASEILDGIINTGTRFVDHAVVEVKLNDRWIAVDSYIIDQQHFEAANNRLTQELGLGIRKDAKLIWDGRTDSFSQYHPEYVEKEFGIFNDVGEFYEKVEKPNNYRSLVQRVVFPFVIGSANEAIQILRANEIPNI